MQNPRFHRKLSEAEFIIFRKMYLSGFGVLGLHCLQPSLGAVSSWLFFVWCSGFSLPWLLFLQSLGLWAHGLQ